MQTQMQMMFKTAGMAASVLMGFGLTLPAEAAIIRQSVSYSGSFVPSDISTLDPIGLPSIGSIQGFFDYDDTQFQNGYITDSAVTDWEFSWIGGATAQVADFTASQTAGGALFLFFGDLTSLIGVPGNNLIFAAANSDRSKTVLYDSPAFGIAASGIYAAVTEVNDNNIPSLVELSSTDPTPIPTPALLPGLIGMGVAAIRKRKLAQSDAV